MRMLPLVLGILVSSSSFADSDYDRWLKQTRTEYSQYREATDREFGDFLKESWQAVGMEVPRELDRTPKPRSVPDAPISASEPITSTPTVVIAPLPQATEPVLDTIPDEPQETVLAETALVRVDFFGHTLNFAVPTNLNDGYHGSPTGKGIAAWWNKRAEVPYKDLANQIKTEARQLQLNDWGTVLLIQHLATAIHNDYNSQALLSWYLAVRCGFDARVAYNQNIYLLLASEQPLYGITYLTVNKRAYYALGYAADGRYDPPRGRLFTYERQHENGKQALDFSNSERFVAAGRTEMRNLDFSFNGSSHSIQLRIHQQAAAYLNLYPQLDLSYYIEAGLPMDLGRDLLNQLKPLVAGKSELEAVNLLLRFTQTAFAYETDEQQFGRENYLFPLETLYFRASDCEDRTILFSWLVKNLLQLDVALVTWPGHVAAAVAFHGNVDGQGWTVGGKRYVIADPTYINANAGYSMPQFATAKPAVQPI